jgi:hypothetical protein
MNEHCADRFALYQRNCKSIKISGSIELDEVETFVLPKGIDLIEATMDLDDGYDVG